ncbi:MAG TPA: hypothetical protein VFV08_00415, partial [Puia sp.]|nr:hypothetical protein [Puia sp.]
MNTETQKVLNKTFLLHSITIDRLVNANFGKAISNQKIMVQWLCKKFDDLKPHELYGIMQLRIAVFVVEQNCVFQDADDKDQFSHHVMCIEDHKVIAYARIVPPG